MSYFEVARFVRCCFHAMANWLFRQAFYQFDKVGWGKIIPWREIRE
jgi:hypothetical protein